MTPHAEHARGFGSNLPIRWNSRPYSRALYPSIAVNADQPASWTDLASRVRASPTAETSPSHARSGVVLAAVSRADSSASVMGGNPAACACCRA